METTQFLTRAQVQALALGNAKFVQALFSPESLQSKRNTEAIEVAPNTLMAGRIVEYKPAAPRPFAEVQDEIRQQLVRKAASEMAQKAGREKLALLEQGKDREAGVAFGKPVTLVRNQPQPGFAPDALKVIFDADPRKLPAYSGAPNERGGFSIYKVEKRDRCAGADAAKLQAAGARVGSEIGRELMTAYLACAEGGQRRQDQSGDAGEEAVERSSARACVTRGRALVLSRMNALSFARSRPRASSSITSRSPFSL